MTSMVKLPNMAAVESMKSFGRKMRGSTAARLDPNNANKEQLEKGGVVTTVAGSGVRGQLDGPPKDCQFHTPCAIAEAPDGTFLVADAYTRALRRLSDAGVSTVVTQASEPYLSGYGVGSRGPSDGPWTWWPGALAFDTGGRLLVADRFSHCVRAVTPASVFFEVLNGRFCVGRGSRGSCNCCRSSPPPTLPPLSPPATAAAAVPPCHRFLPARAAAAAVNITATATTTAQPPRSQPHHKPPHSHPPGPPPLRPPPGRRS